MAQRRMFSLKIVGSDAFVEMSTSARDLYFHLGMYADDDGFVNPRKVMRMIGASEDDLKILIGKRFVLPFENGVVVIKHWKINNLIRKDFYQETIYLEQKKQIITKENNAYTESLQNVNNLSPQVRLGKDSIDSTPTGVTINNNLETTMKKNSFKYNESQSSDTFEDVIDMDSNEKVETKTTNANNDMWEVIRWAESRKGNKFLNHAKQLKAIAKMKSSGITRNEIMNRWDELEKVEYYKLNGFDFATLLNSFDKKR